MIQERVTHKQRKKNSKPAAIVRPKSGLQVPKQVRRLQRQAPRYAMQGLNELSVRLREMTGRNVIDMNRVMELAQFLYRQQELARRGANYEVDEFGFDPQWTESFLSVFMVLYRDYWRGGTPRGEKEAPTSPAIPGAKPARALALVGDPRQNPGLPRDAV